MRFPEIKRAEEIQACEEGTPYLIYGVIDIKKERLSRVKWARKLAKSMHGSRVPLGAVYDELLRVAEADEK